MANSLDLKQPKDDFISYVEPSASHISHNVNAKLVHSLFYFHQVSQLTILLEFGTL